MMRSKPSMALGFHALLAVGLGLAMHERSWAKDAVIEPAKGWRYSVFAQNLPGIDNLVFGGDGLLYGTLEHANGQGQIVRLRNGAVEPVLGEIARPGGLSARGRFLYVVEWTAEGRALEIDLDSGAAYTLAVLRSLDGIAIGRDGDVLVTEDLVNGRVLRLSKTGQIEVVVGGLNRPGGLCVGKKGMLYIAETATGRLLSYLNGTMETVVEDLDEPDEVQLAPDGSLWITEGTNPGTLLRLRDGKLETILAGLVFPQAIAFRPDGHVLVAERGRNRILVVNENTAKAARDPGPAANRPSPLQ